MPPRPASRFKNPFEVVFLAFFALFGVIGLVILRFLWAPSDSFMAPPAIFRAIGSLVALGFMIMGFGVPLSALLHRRRTGRPADDLPEAGVSPDASAPPTATAGYRCPNCGAALGPEQEVSPSGDAKCGYCKRWWNIHRSAA